MGTHIIWRNPSPPAKVAFQLRRVAGNERATVYRVASPQNCHPIELIRTAVSPVRVIRYAPGPAADLPAGAELVLARW